MKRTASGFPLPLAILSTRLTPEDFRSRSVVSANGCWEWSKSRQKNGYGQAWDQGRMRLAHRLSYAAHIGPVPEGMTVDHLCFNHPCVNPMHLRLLTISQNAANNLPGKPFDAEAPIAPKRRRQKREGSPGEPWSPKARQRGDACRRGHAYTPENTYVYLQEGGPPLRHCRACKLANSKARYASKKTITTSSKEQ